MITYSWTIEPSDCVISQDGLTNIVQTIYWRYLGSDEKGNVYEASGAQFMPPPTSDNFIPFDKINSKVIISWLESIMDMKALEAEIASKIQELNNPVIIRLSIPE